MKTLSNQTWRPVTAIFLSFLIFMYSTGCSYFKVNYAQPQDLPSLAALNDPQNYFLLHSNIFQGQLADLKIEGDYLKGSILAQPSTVFLYNSTRSERYKASREKTILQEVHLYLKDSLAFFAPGEVAIPLQDIQEIRIIDPNERKTVTSYVLSIVGGAVGTMILVVILAALLKSSCPYVYVNDGNSFIFEGEAYSGAIFKGLEREDYMPLPSIKPVDNTFKIKISNELKEQQFTNLANLIVVGHPVGAKVLLDAAGVPRLIEAPQAPMTAFSEKGIDYTNQLLVADRDVFLFNEQTDSNQLYLTFSKPRFDQTGKLVLKLKNSLWSDFVYGEFSKKFGGTYKNWVDKQNQIPASSLPDRKSPGDFKLTISVKVGDDWKMIDRLPPVGPMGSREVVVPLTWQKGGSDKLEVRIESSFMFWEIDYAGMDFTEDKGLSQTVLKPQQAFGNDDPDSREALSFVDDQYLVQLQTGEFTELHFIAPITDLALSYSYFLHTKGYYNHVREYKGLPDLTALETFKTPGYFNLYSRNLYREVAGEDLLVNANQ